MNKTKDKDRKAVRKRLRWIGWDEIGEKPRVTRGEILDFLFQFTGWTKVSDTQVEVFEGWLKSKGIVVGR